jgi:hypothetical protein
MVVLINYLHVMTILPSSILVNEIYMAPVQKEFVMWFKQKFLSNKLDHGNECGESVEKNTSPEEPNASEGHEKMKNIVEKSSNDMNSLDRYLVRTYAPFVTRRSSYLIGFPILLVRLVAEIIHQFEFLSTRSNLDFYFKFCKGYCSWHVWRNEFLHE